MPRYIDADALIEDCKRYLGTLNPDKDGKECTRIHWLIGVLENAPTIEPERKNAFLDEYVDYGGVKDVKVQRKRILKEVCLDIQKIRKHVSDFSDLLDGNDQKSCEDAVSRVDVLECFADLYDTFEDFQKGIINELHRKFEDLRTLPSVTSKTGQTEIVLCKDCEHWKNEHLCESLSRFGSFETEADFYCGYGKRRLQELCIYTACKS